MLNKAILMGRLTAAPEHKATPNGTSVTSFSIAVERNFADKQTGKRQADFINIIAWRGTADLICKHFSKGRLIALDGSIQVRSYQDKNGNKRQAVEVIAENVYFTGERATSASSASAHEISGEIVTPFPTYDYEEIETDDNNLS